MEHEIAIREAVLADIPALRDVAIESWYHVYPAFISNAQIEYMLECMYSPSVLERLIVSGEQQFLVLYSRHSGLLLGLAAYGKVDYLAAPSRPGESVFKLHKLYLRPGIQKKGAGSSLLNAVTEKVRALGADRLILNVNRHNPACGFYLKAGFTVLETLDIPYGPFLLTDYIMGRNVI